MGQPYHVRWNPEILRLVISELSSRDQARMALVCHLFWEVTIPVLWRSLPLDQTNRHITHLVPQSVIEFLGGRHIRLAQIPSLRSMHWDRFFSHVKFVRSFEFTLGDSDGYRTVALLRALDNEGVVRLMPLLEKLHVHVYENPRGAEALRCLLSPTLLHLVLEFIEGGIYVSSMSESIQRMLDTTHQLNLQRLRITAPRSGLRTSLSSVRPICRAVEAQRNLQHLELGHFQWRFAEPLTAASCLDNLISASFMEDDCPHDPVSRAGAIQHIAIAPGFPRLRCLRAELKSQAIPTLLNNVTSTSLHSIDLIIQIRKDEPSSLTGTLDDISRFSRLKSLRIVFPQSVGTWNDFSRLLLCTALEVVAIKGHKTSILFTNTEIELMSRAWSALTELEIEDLSRLPQYRRENLEAGSGDDEVAFAPAVTLAGLEVLARACPHLRKLKISIDARVIPFIPHPISNLVTDINFPCSFVGEELAETVKAIIWMFPRQISPRPTWVYLHNWWYDPYAASRGAQTGIMGMHWRIIWMGIEGAITALRRTNADAIETWVFPLTSNVEEIAGDS